MLILRNNYHKPSIHGGSSELYFTSNLSKNVKTILIHNKNECNRLNKID